MQRKITLLLASLLALSACGEEAGSVDPTVIDQATQQTLEAGSANVHGVLVQEEVKGSDTELLAMKGSVDFAELTQSLEFSDSQAQPGEMPETSRLMSDGAEYFIGSTELTSGYPAGTEWVRFTFDDPPPDEGFPDTQALLEPLIAINLLRGSKSAEEAGPEEGSGDTRRFRVIVDFEEAASESPAGISNRLALFGSLTYEKGLDKGLAPVVVEIDEEGLIREVRTALPYYSQDDKLSAHQSYTVRFDDFGRTTSIHKPPATTTADWNPDLYVKGVTPPILRSEELETSATTCEADLEIAGSLEGMARQWGIENPPEERARLIAAIASKYTERYYGSSFTGKPFGPPDLVKVDTEGCTRGILRGLRS